MSQPLLEGRQEYVEERESDVVAQLESRIEQLEAMIPNIKREAVVIVLSLLTESLRHVASGKMDITESAIGSDARWDAIKARLEPRLKEGVDILLLQGPMKRTQIAAALKMDYSNCTKNVIGVLLRRGIAVEKGGHVTLKQL